MNYRCLSDIVGYMIKLWLNWYWIETSIAREGQSMMSFHYTNVKVLYDELIGFLLHKSFYEKLWRTIDWREDRKFDINFYGVKFQNVQSYQFLGEKKT